MSAGETSFSITLDEGRTAFEPGERISGIASWTVATPPRGIEVRLSWILRGKGGRDHHIADTLDLATPLASEQRPFSLTLPREPPSLRGRLVTLSWTIDLVAQPGDETISFPIVIAPGREPALLASRARTTPCRRRSLGVGLSRRW